MSNKFVEPKFDKDAFTCPHCQVLSQMTFAVPFRIQQGLCNNLEKLRQDILKIKSYITENIDNDIKNMAEFATFYGQYVNAFAICQNPSCQKISIWIDEKMVYPKPRLTPLPNDDLPDDIKADYEEASLIVQDSPRGACALLRLALQKLMMHLGKDKNLDRVIKNLMQENIDEDLRKALDSVRVVGNSAVHPNELEIRDKPEIAFQLFKLINFIANEVLTSRKEIREFYNENIPDTAKRENRD